MGERKGLTKYYPPDFDPKLLPKQKRPKGGEVKSVFMLPMAVRCESCGEYMGAGSKFNALKTTATETYLGMKIFRFRMSCKACPASFIIRTDPQNSDYKCESGAKRNFEPWRAEKEAEDAAKELRDEQDMDAMEKLESKTLDARQEMEDADALDELRRSKAEQARISADALLLRHRQAHDPGTGAGGAPTDKQLAEEARIAFLSKSVAVRRLADGVEGDRGTPHGGNGGKSSRKEGDDVIENHSGSFVNGSLTKRKADTLRSTTAPPVVVVKKKRKACAIIGPGVDGQRMGPGASLPEPALPARTGPILTGLGAYDSINDSDSDSSRHE